MLRLRPHALPRDARDTLLLLVVIAWTLLPHAWHLPWWCIVLTTVTLIWRATLALDSRRLPSTSVRMAFLALAVGLTWITYGTVIGKDPGVTLLVMLVVIKTLELRAKRDALIIFFLGFFLIVTNFFYSQSLPVALAMLLSVWGLLTALVLASMPGGRPSVREAGATAARVAAWSLPVMAVLFVAFPRIGPLWGGNQSTSASTGLSNTLRMGGIADLVSNEQIAFRVRFSGEPPSQANLYFRGPVLTHFDGSEWRPAPALERLSTRVGGRPIAYEMIVEPSTLTMIPALEWTAELDRNNERLTEHGPHLRDDMLWRLERPVLNRLQFKATAYPRVVNDHNELESTLSAALRIPEASNPRAAAWMRELIEREPGLQDRGAEALVARIQKHIRDGYTYTHAPGLYGDARGRGAIDEFWLDRKAGFCEHFSTAMVYLLRAAGVPARIVTGYQGADLQLQDGWHVVRQSHAHAWVEAWSPGRGWFRVDPTASVAPDRVELGRTLRAPTGIVGSMLQTIDPTWWPAVRAVWETTQMRWNQWVVQYSRGQQFDLLKQLGIGAPQWEHLVYGVIALLVAASGAGAAWAWWDRRRRDPWERLQSDVRERLQSMGVTAPPHEAPRTLAERVREELGEAGEAAALSLEELDRMRYASTHARRPDPKWWRSFMRASASATRAVRISNFASSFFPHGTKAP